MEKVMLRVEGYRCQRCGHEWIPRDENSPRVCPKCHSAWWNVPKKK